MIKTTHVGGARGLVAELNTLLACSGARLEQLQWLVIALAQIVSAAAVRADLRGGTAAARVCFRGLGDEPDAMGAV